MQGDHFTFGENIFVHQWLPHAQGEFKGIVQIAHGMAEHAARYAHVAGALSAAGYAVFANDHRGHGRTATGDRDRGYFADSRGWQRVVADMVQLTALIRSAHPTRPIFLLGHSMGSFLVRTYMTFHAKPLTGVILSATGPDTGWLGRLGLLIARLECRLRGPRATSWLMNMLTFGGFNRGFRPNRTPFDWLSRDPAVVDAYMVDPLCGGIFRAGFFVDLIAGVNGCNQPANLAKVPSDLPILLLSGERDPVGQNGRGVRRVYEQYKKGGIRDITLKLYPAGRHEMLNEINRSKVYGDIITWLDERCPRHPTPYG